jgi:predicted unusual protein kinase regulating ubiquinone biosynthesis (AarF/ABC1/UbiB family)
MKENLPISSFKRSKTIAKSAIKIGAKKALQYSKKPFMSSENYLKENNKLDNDIANILFENISLLKGTAVKIAQALTLHNMLPSSMQKELSKSYNNIKPIDKALVIKVLKNEFKKDYLEVFQELSLVPFASASLGQVHLASSFKNKKLAVKIQYPSIDKTIQNDIKLMKKFTKFKKNIVSIIEEVEEKLYDEIDYEKELQNNIWAYESFNTKDIIVPKVYKKYSTKHVLTSSYIQGKDLNSWLLTKPSSKNKNAIANSIFEVFTQSIFKHKKIQADPNPANYIITPENKLALIDFGCIKEFNNEFIKNYTELFSIYKSSNKNKILKTYKQMGLIKNIEDIDDDLFQNKVLAFNKWAIEPFLTNEYKITKKYLEKGVKLADIFLNKPFLIVKDFVFLDRTFHGLFSLFEQMDVVIDMKSFRASVDLDT